MCAATTQVNAGLGQRFVSVHEGDDSPEVLNHTDCAITSCRLGLS